MHLFRRPAAFAALFFLSALSVNAIASSPVLPDAPTATINAGGNSLTLSWRAASHAIAYNVYEGTTSGGEAGTPIVFGTTATSLTLTGLTEGNSYFFEVTGVNGAGESLPSNEVGASVLPASPVLQFATIGDGTVTLNWTAVSCATTYNVYMGTRAGRESASPVEPNLTGTSVTVDKLTDGVTYYFTVDAVCPVGSSLPSGEMSAAPSAAGGGVPIPPTSLVASLNGGSGAVTLAWTGVAGATSYNVYAGNSPGGESTTPILTGVTGPGTTLTGLTNNTTYYFTVSALTASGQSAQSNEVSAEPVPSGAGIAVPQNLVVAAGNRTVTLAWDSSPGATSYTVYESSSPFGANFTAVQTGITDTSTTVDSLTNTNTYYYTVTASDISGETAQALNVAAVPTLNNIGYPPAAPTNISAALADTSSGLTTSVTLSWPKVSGASSYSLYQGIEPQNEGAVPSQSGLVPASAFSTMSATVTNLNVGQTYYFKVSSVGDGGQSNPSEEVVVAVPPVSGSKLGAGGAIDKWTLVGLLSLGLMRIGRKRASEH
jgi:fibronectin type 3 domain-containing protein